MSWPWNRDQWSLKVIENDIIRHSGYGFLLVFFVPKTHRFWDTRILTIQFPRNPDSRLLKVIGTDTYRSATYNFILGLTFHSNHGPISYRFWDNRRFQSKIAKFSHPCSLRPCWRGSTRNWVRLCLWQRAPTVYGTLRRTICRIRGC